MCGYVVQSLDAFEQAVYARMMSHRAAKSDSLGGAEPIGEGAEGQPHGNDVPGPQAMAEAMVSVWSEGYNMCGPLEEAVDR